MGEPRPWESRDQVQTTNAPGIRHSPPERDILRRGHKLILVSGRLTPYLAGFIYLVLGEHEKAAEEAQKDEERLFFLQIMHAGLREGS
jgi:hypothetical protein